MHRTPCDWAPIEAVHVLERLVLELGSEREAAQAFLDMEAGVLYGTTDGRLFRYDSERQRYEQRPAAPLDQDHDLQTDLLRRIHETAAMMGRV